jgi:uncharacterized protein (TIRG00374 family)
MADEKSFLRRRWKLILNIVTAAAFLLFAYFLREDLGKSFDNLAHINAWLLLLLLPIQVVNYHAQVKLYQDLFGIVGNKLEYKMLYEAALELNFVNHVFPSAGAAGISYFGLRKKSGAELTGAKATLIQIMKLGLTFLSFEVLLIFGLLSLAAVGQANNLTILVGTLISTLLLVGTGLFIYVVGSKTRINHFFTGVTKMLNRAIAFIRRGHHPETINISAARAVFEDFHENYKQLRESLPKLKAPFWYAMVMNITEITCVYVVFLAFGHVVNFGAIILAYGIANFAGAISVLPGGYGIYEFLMWAVLAAAGVPAGVAIPVVVMYRVLNTLIQVPPGYYLYQRNLSARKQLPEA